MLKKRIKIIIFLFLLLALSWPISQALALDTGVAEVGNAIDLGDADPRETAGRIINIVILFLGVLAVGIIVFAGFLWMTAGGDEEKVSKAKKWITNGVIGLIIVLASWGIAVFILNQLMNATGNTPGSMGCTNGDIQACGCGGSRVCANNNWGDCIGSDCGGGSEESCDLNSLLAGCQPDNTICSENYFCNLSCSCEAAGGLGDPCDTDGLGDDGICSIPDDSYCGEYLQCDVGSCLCVGSPVITGVTPYGGFCDDDVNTPCEEDSDCLIAPFTCNLLAPNGVEDNIISIHGHNFAVSGAEVRFVGDSNDPSDDVIAFGPETVNSNCSSTSTPELIIAVIPSGAQAGPIAVINPDGLADSTDNELGPVISDFVDNNIVRPGLCLLDPEVGLLIEEVEYQGVNLFEASAYFGNYDNKSKGLNENFTLLTGLSGTTQVPNINQGDTSSFVTAIIGDFKQKSNYLDFLKDPEPESGPYIISISPEQGTLGQYVTIIGNGFGNTRGFNTISFGTEEADYDFPAVCLDSVWSDSQVIVKVPASATNGDYIINMTIGSWEIDSSQADPNIFAVDDTLSLAPSLCKISPVLGPQNSPVELWGEYFGQTGLNSVVRFFYNQNQPNLIQADGDAQKLDAIVPQVATSGPVKVIDGGQEGNSLNFTIGACQENDDCGSQICCPLGTFKEGRCEDQSAGNGYANCYVNIPSSVYEWDFSTEWGTSTTTDFFSCFGQAQALGSCQENEFCPNTTGQCSPYPGGGSIIIGGCDSSCNSEPGCASNLCAYHPIFDKCILISQSCSLPEEYDYTLGNEDFTTIQTCNDNSNWQIEVTTSCPDTWTSYGSGVCADENSSCDICSSDFECIYNVGNGICASAAVCGDGSVCQISDNCIIEDDASCSCCCEIDQDERDCCTPLTCEGTCGADQTDNGFGLGYCSGCAAAGSTQAEQDVACNCFDNTGQYCDTYSNPDGICVDCTNLNSTQCAEHSNVCCIDAGAGDVCRGGDGTLVFGGHCAYYDCAGTDPDMCEVNPFITGDYSDFATCEEECPGNSENDCADLTLAECQVDLDCCVDAQDDNACRSGNSIDDGTVDAGYCAYYDCLNPPNDDECNTEDPNTTGLYSDITSCEVGCIETPNGWGNGCSSEDVGVCDIFLCSNPFACIAADGGPPSSLDCGACCCDPSLIGPDDICTSIHEDLFCSEDQTPCDGDDRGLCCGCITDSECGGDFVGCGSATCCRARPEVEDTVPAHLQVNVCRNVMISASFDQAMNTTGFAGNLLLLEEHDYGDGSCPEGTFITFINLEKPVKLSWFDRMTNSILSRLNLTPFNQAFADVPDPNKLYCGVPGSIGSEQNIDETTVITFQPNKILDPSTNYYVVAKGDVELDSSGGVLSLWSIGMNGRGYWDIDAGSYVEGDQINFNNKNYPNSHIWRFTTLSDQGDNAGICEINYVTVEPSDYLFQSTQNDVTENDSDPGDPTYDTVKDRDKVYIAKAFSSENQRLARMSGYDWDWKWDIDNSDVVDFSGVSSLPDTTYSDSQMVVARADIQDGQTFVQAEVDMSGFTNMSDVGDGISQSTLVYVFVCQNPWPPVDPITFGWSPWADALENCNPTLPGVTCDNYNYNFYYCRDAGADGTFDDLPAILDSSAIIRGSSKICSDGSGPCASDLDCTDGICIWNVLKESYFFRQQVPELGDITEVEDLETGGSVKVLWHSNSYLVDYYKIYYRSDQEGQDRSVDVYPEAALNSNDPTSGRACLPENPTADQDYICQFVINSLENDITHIFRMTAISSNGAESPLSSEVTGVPTDSQPPIQPKGLGSGFSQ